MDQDEANKEDYAEEHAGDIEEEVAEVIGTDTVVDPGAVAVENVSVCVEAGGYC